MIILDASVLLAFLALEDPHHLASTDILAGDGPFGAHTMTLAESLVRGERDGRGMAVASTFAQLGVSEIDRLDDEPRRLARLRVNTRLALPDCCVLMLAESLSASLATFDDRLARAAGERGIEVLGAGR